MEEKPRESVEEQRADTLIIGAGAAGLAVGACLRRRGLPFIMVDKADYVGAAWRTRYDRLHLHTNRRLSALPYLAFPKEYPRYPSCEQVVEYLEAYAEKFDIRPQFGQEVVSVAREGAWWQTRTRERLYRSRHVVIATGHARVPKRPSWPGQGTFPGPFVHSSEYRNGRPYRGQSVLVVGFGNSGGEIAIDLYEHGATPRIVVRSPANVIPRDLLGVPVLAISSVVRNLPTGVSDTINRAIQRVLYGDIEQYGIQFPSYGPMTQVKQHDRIPLIDIGTIDLIRKGHVEVRPGIEEFEGSDVLFEDGRREAYDAVVLATGFRPRVDAFLQDEDSVLDERGYPYASGEEVAPGLYFCGYEITPRGVLRDIHDESLQIAERIEEKTAAVEAQPRTQADPAQTTGHVSL